MALRDIGNDLSNFHILKYAGRVDGYLATSKNSGTHWLRFILSAAIAHRLGLPAPERSSGPDSDTFIGHPRHRKIHANAPRIGSSHNIPSRLVTLLAGLGLMRLPPTVVLVRDIREALLSYYVKWREPYGLGELSDFVRRPAPGRRKVEDLWWFVRFFNRWGGLARATPERVLVVRYEDVEYDPATWIRRIWAHWGVELADADVQAALAVSSRQVLAARLDPEHGEAVVSDAGARAAVRLSAADEAEVQRVLDGHLISSFGYSGPASLPRIRRQVRASPSRRAGSTAL
ncbi:sulfotransferase domain-containing protein [Phenylobacterium sp.]|uniref:sulfotransferase domain-containing protein n=1 Tax=Phenylobacterium sp. TaxID=1871053 RepID=UPI0035AE67C9